jgi:hypothetical protein
MLAEMWIKIQQPIGCSTVVAGSFTPLSPGTHGSLTSVANVPSARLQVGQQEGDEELDAGEAFERAELQRIMATDPDSSAFHMARKKSTMAGGGGRHAAGRAHATAAQRFG